MALALRARQIFLYALVACGCSGLTGLAYLLHFCRTRLYARRVVRFWWTMGPILLHYRWALRGVEAEQEREERLRELHGRYAPLVRRLLGDMRGLYTKVAQVCSVVPTLLPEEYKLEFQKLQQDAPEASWPGVQAVLEQELGAPLESVFQDFERRPLGCASIGQVHMATWRQRRVVVKVQYPEAAECLRADFDCMEATASLNDKTGFALNMAQKTRRQFEQELDYVHETQNLAGLKAALDSAPEFAGRLLLPAPIPELTRGRVIAMDFVPGAKITELFLQRLRDLGHESLAENLLPLLSDGNVASSTAAAGEGGGPEPGRTASASSAAGAAPVGVGLRLLSRALGPHAAIVVESKLAELGVRCRQRCRLVAASCGGTQQSALEPVETLHGRLRLLLDLQGYQFFFCPVFNGDPHPGNFLAVPDGRVGVIDLGQCARFQPAAKLGFARLLLALRQPDSLESSRHLAEILRSMGVRTVRGDDAYLAFICRFVLTSMRGEWLHEEGAYIKAMMARDAILDQPIEILLVSRASALLRGFGMLLGENVDPSRYWAPWAERWLREQGQDA